MSCGSKANVWASAAGGNRAPLIVHPEILLDPGCAAVVFGIPILFGTFRHPGFPLNRYAWTGGRLSFAIRSAKGMQVVLGRGGRYIQGRYIPCLQEGDASVTSKQASARMLGESFVHVIGSAGK